MFYQMAYLTKADHKNVLFFHKFSWMCHEDKKFIHNLDLIALYKK